LLTRATRILGLTILLVSAAAHAQARGNRVYFGQDIFVASGQQVHNAVCVFCSVQVEGDLTGRALVLFGSLNVTGRVDRNATVIGGNAVIDSQARIGGNTVVLGGNAVYETDDSISGSAYVLGGHLSKMGGHVKSSRRLSVSPVIFSLLALLAIFLL
jgi:carbonic anhydrase/acetyltransferase-like protein (isoleucine patch superfamily)